jgi:hypothetical protein
MPTIDFTSGYRDATQGSTLKALAARRAEMAANMAARKMPQINDPWQGAAEVANTISGSIREGRLASQEAAGRQRFAQLLSGGLAPDEIGEAMGLDPETTQMYVKNDWDVKAAADRIEADRKAKEAEHTFQTTTAATLARTQETAAVSADTRGAAEKRIEEGASADAAAKAAAAADNRTLLDAALRGDNEVSVDEAVKRGLMPAEDGARLKDQIKRQTEADIASKTPETFTQVTPEMVTQLGLSGEIAAHPEQFQRSGRTGQITPYQKAAGAPALKEVYDAKDKLASTDSHLDDLNRALELNDKVIQGPAGNILTTVVGSDPFGVLPGIADAAGQKERIDATKEFSQLMSAGAMTRMAEELKGSTAYQELLHYQELFASPTSSALVRKNALVGMINALKKHRNISAQRLESYGADRPGEYTYTPRTTNDTGPAAPAEDYKEGDIVSSPGQPDLVLKGGKWVQVQ